MAASHPFSRPFQDSAHHPFFWKAGKDAALLVHGFPGTPAEMRPLGQAFKEAGWTVEGVLLPGFGPNIGTLERRSFNDWIDAVKKSFEALRQKHEQIVIVGNSMGGALALLLATEQRPAGLVLLAPFWSLGNKWLGILWPALKLIVRNYKPFKRADFSAPEVRRALSRTFSGVDLDDAEVQQRLRQLTIPVKSLEQVHELGRRAFRKAPSVEAPKLVIQGCRDPVVPPERTRLLVSRFPKNTQYQEVNGGHDLVEPDAPAWIDVVRLVMDFARAISGNEHENGGI